VLIRIIRNPLGAIYGSIIAGLIVVAIAAPWIAPYDPIATSVDTFQRPSLTHLLGTDHLGRDQLTRIMYGSRMSLYVGLLAVSAGTMTGAFVGLISGFLGGYVDLIVQRLVDGLLALPGIVLAMALVSVLGTNTTNALLAISVVIAPSASRVIRSAVLSVKQDVYIDAARSIGASNQRVIFRHVLPNVVAPILILVSAGLGTAILIEASLSFLGLATQPPDASWGLMLASAETHMERAPWLSIVPGLAITITVLAFNLFGDVIRDVLDPRLRGAR
jgi:peptide/nickel transport system permease protein